MRPRNSAREVQPIVSARGSRDPAIAPARGTSREDTQSVGRDLGHNRHAVPDKERPPANRDCLNCGATDGMKLQNVAGTAPTNIPLLYICGHCGASLTIPPPRSPVLGS